VARDRVLYGTADLHVRRIQATEFQVGLDLETRSSVCFVFDWSGQQRPADHDDHNTPIPHLLSCSSSLCKHWWNLTARCLTDLLHDGSHHGGWYVLLTVRLQLAESNTSTVTSAADTATAAVDAASSAIPYGSTTTLAPSTSVITADPVTTYVAPSLTVQPTQDPTTVVTQITSVVTGTGAGDPNTGGAIFTTIYSTLPPSTITPTASDAATRTQTSTSSSSTRTALSAAGSGNGSSGGLSSGATIAIGVIIPVVAVVALVLLGLWLWRRRKAKKDAEELRKNEMAEYGFNPNNDPTLPVGAVYADGSSEGNDDSGYRGWGATTASNRKASTTLGSNSRAAAMGGATAMSESGSQSGYNMQHSPSVTGSDVVSQDPLFHGYSDPAAAGAVGGAAIGGAAVAGAGRNRHSQAVSSIHRGPSNASSAYSGHGIAPSEASSDVPEVPRPYYQEEVPYNIYNDVQPGHGPYGDATYGGQNDQPVIRDVQARRNTRIERAPTFPQQGGIAQNF